MHTVADNAWIFGADLDIVGRLELPVVEMVVFHAHKSGIGIRLTEAIAIPADRLLLLKFLKTGQALLTQLPMVFIRSPRKRLMVRKSGVWRPVNHRTGICSRAALAIWREEYKRCVYA